MSAQPKHEFITPEEYLARDRAAKFKSEYFSGEMVAAPLVGFRHESIATNLAAELGRALRHKACRPRATSNLRVKVRSSGFVYPDALVFCGEPDLVDDGYLDTLKNPSVLLDVLSPSTELSDHPHKAAWYEAIPSVAHYVFIAQDKVRVEVYTRQENGDWMKHVESTLDGVMRLPAIGVEIALSDLYEDTGVVEETG